MTTIATDGLTIAAEGQAQTSWGSISSRSYKKVRVANDCVFALTGAAGVFDALIAWHKAGCDPSTLPECTKKDGWCLLEIRQDGSAHMYTQEVPYADPIEFPFALGTGCDFAVGAMDAGKSPREAVEIAIRRDANSGGNIDVIDIKEALGLREPGLRVVNQKD